eukprot:gene13246-15263_t
MEAAAGAGQLALVKQLHAQGCPWDESAPIAALNENKEDCLQYFLELRGVPNDPIFKSATVPFDCWMVIHNFKHQRLLGRFFRIRNVASDKRPTVLGCLDS